MKKLLFIILILCLSQISYGQDISDVSRSHNTLTVLDSHNKILSSKWIYEDDELCGFSENIIVVKSSNIITVYDQKFNTISTKWIYKGDRVKNVSGNSIIIKSGSVVTTYDKKFNVISSRYEQ